MLAPPTLHNTSQWQMGDHVSYVFESLRKQRDLNSQLFGKLIKRLLQLSSVFIQIQSFPGSWKMLVLKVTL